MFWPSEAYKHIFKNRDKSLGEIKDRIDCLQRSQIYVHNHITKVENDIDELKKLILKQPTHFDSPGPRSQNLIAQINFATSIAEFVHTDTEPYDVQMAEVN